MGNPTSCGRGRPLSLHILLRELAGAFISKTAWAAFCNPLSYFMYATQNSASITAHFLSKELSVPPALTEDMIYTSLCSCSQDVSRFPNLFSPHTEPLSSPSWKLTLAFLLTPLTWVHVLIILLFASLFCSWFSKWFLKDLASPFPLYLNGDFDLWWSDRQNPLLRPRHAFTFPFCPQGGGVRRHLDYSVRKYSAKRERLPSFP